MNKKKAIALIKGRKYTICCDINFIQTFFQYVMTDDQHQKEIKIIFAQILEGLRSKKYGDEPFGTKSMKPFMNRANDRIICHVLKRKGDRQCIIMAELFSSKKSNSVNKELNTRYKIVSRYEYEIVE